MTSLNIFEKEHIYNIMTSHAYLTIFYFSCVYNVYNLMQF